MSPPGVGCNTWWGWLQQFRNVCILQSNTVVLPICKPCILRPPHFLDQLHGYIVYDNLSILPAFIRQPAKCEYFYSDLEVVTYCKDHCGIKVTLQMSNSIATCTLQILCLAVFMPSTAISLTSHDVDPWSLFVTHKYICVILKYYTYMF